MLKLQRSSLVYRCTALDGSSLIAKLIPGGATYPIDLHQEAAGKGHAPAIHDLAAEKSYPGDFLLLEMEDLTSSSGWEPMHRYSDNKRELKNASESALAALHSCLDGAAVHGDVRTPNIFVRWANVKRSSCVKYKAVQK